MESFELEFTKGFFSRETFRIPFAKIGKGSFTMGDIQNTHPLNIATPAHKVSISRSFYISKYPVTQKIWKAVMGKNPSQIRGEELPVTNISWRDCIRFCWELNGLLGFEKVYYKEEGTKNIRCHIREEGVRLPTEAEWEYCARAKGTHVFSGGDNLYDVGWFNENTSSPMPVGKKKSNDFFLYDMSGNVFEWCWDLFDRDYYEACGQEVVDPQGSTYGTKRIKRGGAWLYSQEAATVCMRGFESEDYESDTCGFRIVTPSLFRGESVFRHAK